MREGRERARSRAGWSQQQHDDHNGMVIMSLSSLHHCSKCEGVQERAGRGQEPWQGGHNNGMIIVSLLSPCHWCEVKGGGCMHQGPSLSVCACWEDEGESAQQC